MSKRFDEVVVEEAKTFAERLRDAHPEVRSVAVVLDWDYPDSGGTTLPGGIYVLSKSAPQAGIVGMLGQLAKMLQLILSVGMRGKHESSGGDKPAAS